MTWVQCQLGFARDLCSYQKTPFKNFCYLQFSHKLRTCNFFFNGLLYISCMGWEVKIDMSGQSNDCLRVCNVKMKIFNWGGNRAHFHEFTGCSL